MSNPDKKSAQTSYEEMKRTFGNDESPNSTLKGINTGFKEGRNYISREKAVEYDEAQVVSEEDLAKEEINPKNDFNKVRQDAKDIVRSSNGNW